jgi:copper transport protein
MQRGRWLLALAAAWSGGALGHAGLVASTPADGASLGAPPASIELRFTEPVTPVAVRLLTGSENPIVLTAPQVESDVMTVPLPASLRLGLYVVSFRVISKDSHPVGGSIVFAVGEGSPPPRHAGVGEGDGLSAWTVALRGVRDLALLLAAGAALFVLLIARFPAERDVLASAGVVAIVAALACIGAHGTEMADSGFWALDAWRSALPTSVGLSACIAAAGALLIVVAARLSGGRLRSALLAAGALAAIGSLPLTGHASAAQPRSVALSALAAHGLAAAFWIGSLAALLAILRARTSGAAAALVLRRFSAWGMVGVAVLVAAGITLAFLQLDSVALLFGSRYGWLIAGKIVLLLALVLLAVLNRFRWLPMLERGVTVAAGRLRWSVAAEVALVVCVIGLTAVLVQTPPPRAAGAAGGFTQKLAYKDDFAVVTVTPARAGANAIVVRFQDRDGLPFDPEEVLVEVGNPAAGVERAARPIRRVGPGDYRRDGRELAFPGHWTVEVQARIDNDVAVFRTQVPVR